MYRTKDIDQKLKEKLEIVKTNFNDHMLRSRIFSNKENPFVQFCIIYFENLVSKAIIQDAILKPILSTTKKFNPKMVLDDIAENIITSHEIMISSEYSEFFTNLMYGRVLLLSSVGDEALLIDANERVGRTVEEPMNETMLKGPREGFTESIVTNTALIRRKIISSDLMFEYMQVGSKTNTRLCISYMNGVVDKQALSILKKRLKKINIDSVLDTNPIAEQISDSKYSFFEIVGNTEKPDTLCSKILEGKIGIILDGSPIAIYVPCLFVENFQSGEDYYLNYLFASLARVLRFVGFIISVSLPALYVAVVTHHWEMLPSPLALTISQSQQNVPFPTALECFVLLITFELLRETGLRTPSGIGQPLSVVGAIVIGQAAVEARLVSSVMVVVVALTAITGLINNKIKGSIIVIRFVFLIVASFLGIYGFLFALSVLLNQLLNVKSFGVQYTEGIFPLKLGNVKDSILRLPEQDGKSEKIKNKG